MPWVCVEKTRKAIAHYFEGGAALCGRIAAAAEVGDAEGMAKAPQYACGSCRQKLRIRERRVKA